MQAVSSIDETLVGLIQTERGTTMCAEFDNRIGAAADLRVVAQPTTQQPITAIDSTQFDDTGWSEEEHAQFLCTIFKDFRFRPAA